MSTSRTAALEAADHAHPAGRRVIWHTAGSGKMANFAALVRAALWISDGQAAVRDLRGRLSLLLHETEHLRPQFHGGVDNLTALEAGVHDLIDRMPTPEPRSTDRPVGPELPGLFSGPYRFRMASRPVSGGFVE